MLCFMYCSGASLCIVLKGMNREAAASYFANPSALKAPTEDAYMLVLKNKARLMIEAGQFSSLLHFSRKTGEDLGGSRYCIPWLGLEVAYCYYRLAKYGRALTIIRETEPLENTQQLRLLKAQTVGLLLICLLAVPLGPL